MSVTAKKRTALTSDQNFTTVVAQIASLERSYQNMTDAQFTEQWEKITASIRELKIEYPDLNDPSKATVLINHSIDKLTNNKNTSTYCDSCLGDFIKAVFSCFSSCGGPRSTVKACVDEARANYQACKAGQNR
jgi:hypothetical protein